MPQGVSFCLVFCKPITHESQDIYSMIIMDPILCISFQLCLTIWICIFWIFPHKRQVSGKTKPRLVVRSVRSCRLFAQCLHNDFDFLFRSKATALDCYMYAIQVHVLFDLESKKFTTHPDCACHPGQETWFWLDSVGPTPKRKQSASG